MKSINYIYIYEMCHIIISIIKVIYVYIIQDFRSSSNNRNLKKSCLTDSGLLPPSSDFSRKPKVPSSIYIYIFF